MYLKRLGPGAASDGAAELAQQRIGAPIARPYQILCTGDLINTGAPPRADVSPR